MVDPFIAFLHLHRNPYPLVLKCLKESGLTAFFTRSSATNIPINMALCESMGLDKDMYSVSIPYFKKFLRLFVTFSFLRSSIV